MGRESRTNTAPDQNAHCECQPSWGFDFLGYHFERGMKWPGEEPGQVQRSHPAENKENASRLNQTNR
jgi:hypothetical protein